MKRTYRRKGLSGSRAGGDCWARTPTAAIEISFLCASSCAFLCASLCLRTEVLRHTGVLKNPPTKYLENGFVEWALDSIIQRGYGGMHTEEHGVKSQFSQITTLVERVIFV